MSESIKDEISYCTIIGVFGSIFYMTMIFFGFFLFAFYSPILFILVNYSLTRKFIWPSTIIQIVISAGAFIYTFNFLMLSLLTNWFSNIEDLSSFVNKIIITLIFSPLTYFVVYIIVVSLLKNISDFIFKKMKIKEALY